jgi:predicted RNA-binding protein YlqC (UPF0109 family)
MRDTLIFLLTKIVNHPEAISVDEQTQDSRMLFTIHAHPEDYGQIIGKNGRIIKAIRDLTKLMATKNNCYVDVVLSEETLPEA